MCIQYRRPLPYRADRSARYGKDILYAHVILYIICTRYVRCYSIHVKRGWQILRLNGFPIVNFKQDYIKTESENQKSGLINLLVLFHSACPYKNYCLKCFTELQTLFIYLSFFFLLSNKFSIRNIMHGHKCTQKMIMMMMNNYD